MEILNTVFGVFIIAGPIVFGAWAMLFSRRFSLDMYRFRKAVWRIGYADSDVRIGQVFVTVIGAVLLITGLIVAIQWLEPGLRT